MDTLSDKQLEELMRKNQVVLSGKQRRYLRVKRLLDVVLALPALILLSPVMLVVAIAIKVDAPKEPVIFRQKRVGQGSRLVTVYKFRSMKQGTPERGTNEFVNAEHYITKVGKFIRKTSLDELPQLWSVLVGSMSLIGPRPLIPREDEVHYLREYYGIYQLKPGITGLAQVNGRDNMNDYEKVRWDRAYVHNLSFSMDFEILCQTVGKVLKREGVMDDGEQKKSMAYRAYDHTNEVYGDEIEDVWDEPEEQDNKDDQDEQDNENDGDDQED